MVNAARSKSVGMLQKPQVSRELRRSRSESLVGSDATIRRASSEVFPTARAYISALQALAVDMADREDPEQERERVEEDTTSIEKSDRSFTPSKSNISRLGGCDTLSTTSQEIMIDDRDTDNRSSSITEKSLVEGEIGKGKQDVTEAEDQVDITEAPTASRESIHLWSMRISQHLRTASLATQQTAVERSLPERSSQISPGTRDVADQSVPNQTHHRQQSSAGFETNGEPTTRDNLVSDTASSVYSSRMHTPAHSPQSFNPSPDLIGRYKLPIAYLPRGEYPKIRLETSEGAHTLVSSEHHFTLPSQNHHIRELPSTSPAEASLESVLLSPSTDDKISPKRQQRSQIPLSRSTSSTSDHNGPESKRSSRFKEDDERPLKKTKYPRRPSLFNLFRPAKSKPTVTSDTITVSARYDGSADSKSKGKKKADSACIPQAGGLEIQGDDEASNLFAKALIANQEEKAALIMPENRNQLRIPLHAVRERSASVSSKSIASLTTSSSRRASASPLMRSYCARSADFNAPKFLTPSFGGEASSKRKLAINDIGLDPLDTASVSGSSVTRRISSPGTQTNASLKEFEIEKSSTKQSSENSMAADLGAWARYPSHTRPARTGSAGQRDNVFSRDFALELLRRRPSGETASERVAESSSTPSRKNKKKGKRWISTTTGWRNESRVAGAKRVIKGYSQMFKSQSMEFMAHGHGHRTSTSGGGKLDHPELEILPPVFTSSNIDSNMGGEETNAMKLLKMPWNQHEIHDDDSVAEGNSVDARLRLDGTSDVEKVDIARQISRASFPKHQHDPFRTLDTPARLPALDSALLWSQLYASCVELPTSRSITPVGSLSSTSSRASSARCVYALLRRSISSPMSLRSESPCLRLSPQIRSLFRSTDLLGRTKSPSLNDLKQLDSNKKRKRSSEGNHGHIKHERVRSFRDSTNDLCTLLAETEKIERSRLLNAAEALVSHPLRG